MRKEECLGHTQKRLKGLLKKASTKQLVSKPIGPTKLERVSHLYGAVYCTEQGKSPEEIQKALYVLADHLVENHDNCPHTRDYWCYMGKNTADMKDDDTILPVNPEPHSSQNKNWLVSWMFFRSSPALHYVLL